MLERGKIQSITDDGYIVASLDRDGIVTPPIRAEELASENTSITIDSSKGTIFRGSEYETDLTVIVWSGALQITDITALHERYGASAKLVWTRKRNEEEQFSPVPTSKITSNGFKVSLTAEDTADKAIYQCDLDAEGQAFSVGDIVYYIIFPDGTGKIVSAV